MKVLVIQNGSSLPKQLIALLPPANIVTYPLSDELNSIDPNTFDLVVLSGSSRFPIQYSLDVIQAELDLIKRCTVPLLGVCYGCELIAVTYGATLFDRGEQNKIKGIYSIYPTKNSFLIKDSSKQVYEAHRWVIENLPPELIVDADSEFGPEIIRHIHLPQIGFQFHPEKFVSATDGDDLFKVWFKQVVAR